MLYLIIVLIIIFILQVIRTVYVIKKDEAIKAADPIAINLDDYGTFEEYLNDVNKNIIEESEIFALTLFRKT